MVAEYRWSDRSLIVESLRDERLEIHEADNGRVALDLSRIIRPDLLIIAADLPVLTGLEVLARVRVDRRIHDLPVIVLVDDDRAPTVAAAFDAGATDVAVTPLDREDLVQRTRRALSDASAA